MFRILGRAIRGIEYCAVDLAVGDVSKALEPSGRDSAGRASRRDEIPLFRDEILQRQVGGDGGAGNAGWIDANEAVGGFSNESEIAVPANDSMEEVGVLNFAGGY